MHSNSNICRFIFPMWTEWLQDSPLTARQPQIRQNEWAEIGIWWKLTLKYEDSGSRQILVLVPWFRLCSRGVYKLDLTNWRQYRVWVRMHDSSKYVPRRCKCVRNWVRGCHIWNPAEAMSIKQCPKNIYVIKVGAP